MGRYSKFIIMVAVTVLSAVAPLVNDGLSAAEIINAIILLFGTVLTYGMANMSAGVWRYAKTICAVGSAVAVLAVGFISDGMVSPDEILQMIIAGAGAAGIVPFLNNAGSAPNGASTEATGMPPGTDAGLIAAGVLAA